MTDNDYPTKTCAIERLVTQPKLVAAALAGHKTQQRRDGLYAYPGETFILEGVEFEVTSVERHKIGDMTDADAQAEGFPSLALYKDIILKMHANMVWNDEGLVWVHSFKRRQPE
ncbi:ASCH domain-containing protein [Methylomonas sp. AM2-LC]|uniref:ASCH domain-containing protein n=1 Tax=Methylomonas sp. AM2-LC TaxID=3153301 RepID=UPI00326603CE